MEDFEFLAINPMGDLLKKGARHAGSAVKKSFAGTMKQVRKIPGKASALVPRLRPSGGGHHGAIREAFAKNPLIKDRYQSYVGHAMGKQGGEIAKKTIGGPGPQRRLSGGKRGRLVAGRMRGLNQVGTSRRGLQIAGVGAGGQQLVKSASNMYSSIENLIRLDANLDEAIEFSKKPVKTIHDLTQKKIKQMKALELLRKLR